MKYSLAHLALMPNGHMPQPDSTFLFNNMQGTVWQWKFVSNISPQEHHVDDLLNMQLYSAVHTAASENSTSNLETWKGLITMKWCI